MATDWRTVSLRANGVVLYLETGDREKKSGTVIRVLEMTCSLRVRPSEYENRPSSVAKAWITSDIAPWPPGVQLLEKFTRCRCKTFAFTFVSKPTCYNVADKKCLYWKLKHLGIECLWSPGFSIFNSHLYLVFFWCKAIVLTIIRPVWHQDSSKWMQIIGDVHPLRSGSKPTCPLPSRLAVCTENEVYACVWLSFFERTFLYIFVCVYILYDGYICSRAELQIDKLSWTMMPTCGRVCLQELHWNLSFTGQICHPKK